MGYHTEFKGELKFTKELTASQLAKLNSMFGEDCREHPEWESRDLHYIDLEFNEDFSGIRWDGGEKTYSMDGIVNLILREMRRKYPNFGLKGKFVAQGEDIEDRWELVIEKGQAVRRILTLEGKVITCPHCAQRFEYEEGE